MATGIGRALMEFGSEISRSALAAKAEENRERRRLRLEAQKPGEVVWTEKNGQLFRTVMTTGGNTEDGRYIEPRVLNERPATAQERQQYETSKQTQALGLADLLARSADRDMFGRSTEELTAFANSEDATAANAARKELDRQARLAEERDYRNATLDSKMSIASLRASGQGGGAEAEDATQLAAQLVETIYGKQVPADARGNLVMMAEDSITQAQDIVASSAPGGPTVDQLAKQIFREAVSNSKYNTAQPTTPGRRRGQPTLPSVKFTTLARTPQDDEE